MRFEQHRRDAETFRGAVVGYASIGNRVTLEERAAPRQGSTGGRAQGGGANNLTEDDRRVPGPATSECRTRD